MSKILYHGSCWKRNDGILFPGYFHSGELKKWDETESNKFLYADEDKNEAIRQSIYALVERDFKVVKIHGSEGKIIIEAHDVILPKDILSKTVYLYMVPMLEKDEWTPVKNKVNGMLREWKTPCAVKYTDMHHIRVSQFLRGYEIVTMVV